MNEVFESVQTTSPVQQAVQQPQIVGVEGHFTQAEGATPIEKEVVEQEQTGPEVASFVKENILTAIQEGGTHNAMEMLAQNPLQQAEDQKDLEEMQPGELEPGNDPESKQETEEDKDTEKQVRREILNYLDQKPDLLLQAVQNRLEKEVGVAKAPDILPKQEGGVFNSENLESQLLKYLLKKVLEEEKNKDEKKKKDIPLLIALILFMFKEVNKTFMEDQATGQKKA